MPDTVLSAMSETDEQFSTYCEHYVLGVNISIYVLADEKIGMQRDEAPL